MKNNLGVEPGAGHFLPPELAHDPTPWSSGGCVEGGLSWDNLEATVVVLRYGRATRWLPLVQGSFMKAPSRCC